MDGFERQVLADLATLKAHMASLLGNGQPGRLQKIEARVEEHEGLLQRAIGVGALCDSLSMAYFSKSERKGRIQAIAGTTLGLGLLTFGVFSGFRAFALVLLALFVVGMANDFYSTINNTLIMLNTERALYGRVMSLYMMTWSLSSLSSAPFGALMDGIGGPATMILIGGTLAVFVAGMATLHPGYRRLT